MNQYAVRAQQHWRTHLPNQYRQIADPRTFFTTLGQQAATAIEQLTEDLAGDDPPGETYLEKLGRLNAARQEAEATVLREMTLLPVEDDQDEPTEASPRA